MLRKISLIAAMVLIAGTTVNSFAQKVKLGYVRVEAIFTEMPERAEAEQAITEYSKQLENQLQTMNAEFEKKYQEYEDKYETWGAAVRKDKELEIQNLQQRIQGFQQSAQGDLQQKEQELLQPIYEKIRNAIKKVGEAEGFTYIYDASMLLYKSDDSEDLTEKVKAQLDLVE
ncbi:MAG: OmpH family outer membrane protein [Candidatus Delongbacteria bacterium]|jgi:outer membrane protein|nr:OmpH family outer membrane protein [Candidatus Delongbacteria bacterium]